MIMDENHQFVSFRHHQAAEIGPKIESTMKIIVATRQGVWPIIE